MRALTKRTNNPNTAAEAECAADAYKTRLFPPRIGESAIGHLQNGPGVASHPHQATRLREGELDRGRSKRIVTLGLRFFLDKGRQVSWVVGKLLILVVNDVSTDGVKKA